MYSVEGAFTITIFTALFMVIISIISIVRTEIEIQSAISETAKTLSMYSYAVTGKTSSENETTVLRTVLMDVKREAVAHSLGAATCQKLLKDKIDDKALSLVEDGFEGIDFLSSSILGDGKTIEIVAIYKIEINAFGFLKKTMKVRQEAKTYAWLPLGADELMVEQESNVSIWKETNFTRGKYFVKKIKEEQKENAVLSGQGIDMYDKTTKTATEVYSINVFNNSYSYNGAPNAENLTEQIESFVAEFEEDIAKLDKTIILESGSTEEFLVKKKVLIIVVPIEAKESESYLYYFEQLSRQVLAEANIEIKILYLEEAL